MQYAETPIKDAIEIIQNVDCPDGLHYCPDGTTCCKANDGGYGCCSMSDAVCCKGGFFSESAMCFSNLLISKKNIPKNYPGLEI